MDSRHKLAPLPQFARGLGVFSIALGFAFGVSVSLGSSLWQDAELLQRGRMVYEAQCASCRGQEGKGDGPAARFLDPKPRDFTAGEWKYASEGTVEEITSVVTNGIDDTAMTPFSDVLSGEQISAVAAYVVNVLVPRGRASR